MNFDMTNLRKAVKALAAETGRTKMDLMNQAAKGFVRNVILITPPASKSNTGTDAKKAGEMAIATDVARIFMPLSTNSLNAIVAFQGAESRSTFGHKGAKALGTVVDVVLARAQMAAFHSKRRNADGRVGGPKKGSGTNRDRAAHLTTGLRKKDLQNLDLGLVSKGDYDWFLKLLQKNVGYLAAGWNKAAAKLGVSVPAWIKRHQDAPGVCEVTISLTHFRIVISNAVPFVGNVRGIDERIEHALNYGARGMERQAKFLMDRAKRKAGFK